ncbi:MAG: OB-fold domain-containing protein [Acidimicrobiales bacterium]
MSGSQTRFEPEESVAGAPFWAATRERRLVLPWCRVCERAHWFPREFCPFCLGTDLEWREASGNGVVYAVSVMSGPANPFMEGRAPSVVALIDLPEGVRMMSNVVSAAPEEVAVGQAVRVSWEPLTDGRHLVVFEPAP